MDVLLPNLDEARLLSGTDDAEAAALALLELAGTVVVTTGARGAVAATRGASTLEHAAAPPATVVDTTGAGDAFAAGFLAALVERGDVRTCLVRGLRAATRAVGAVGAQPPTGPS